MNINEFQKGAEEMIDYIADYFDSLSQKSVTSVISPGYLQSLLPSSAPSKGESFETIMEDFQKYIIPGLTHWQHRNFHAFFPASSSYPSILGEMISDIIGSVNFSWNLSCSDNELEEIVLDWYGKMVGLPDDFLYYGKGNGGAFLRNSTSECVFISLITARQDVLKRLKLKNPSDNYQTLLLSLVAYCSKDSHSCVEKAAMVAMVTMKVLDTDETFRLRGDTFAKAVEEDKKHGLIPFFVSITMGTTTCASCDPIDEIGPICEENGIWLNVDAAYAGTALICPEYSGLLNGIEFVSSFIINSAKLMLINIDGAVIWTKDNLKMRQWFICDRTLLNYSNEKGWCHPLNRRFRALKLWFVIRNYGIDGLQKHIRNHVKLAKIFEKHVRADARFEVITSHFGLVCLRIKGSNALNKKLLMSINASGKLHLSTCDLNEKYVLRFCMCATDSDESDIKYAWSVICDFATDLLKAKQHL